MVSEGKVNTSNITFKNKKKSYVANKMYKGPERKVEERVEY